LLDIYIQKKRWCFATTSLVEIPVKKNKLDMKRKAGKKATVFSFFGLYPKELHGGYFLG